MSRGGGGRVLVAGALVAGALLGAPAGAQPWSPSLGPPRGGVDGGLVWERAAEPASAELAPWRAALAGAAATDSGRVAAWRALAHDPRWRLYALKRLAALHLARGDSVAADTCLRPLAAARGIWQWQALSDRADLALARRDSAGALRRIEDAGRDDWPDEERAQWLSLAATLRAATGDSVLAIELGRQALRRYPSSPATARLLPRWESWLRRRGQSPGVDDQRSAAEVEFFRPDRAAAARRLEGVLQAVEGPVRAAVGLRLGEMLRLARRFGEADRALARAEEAADSPGTLARIDLERARTERDAGHAERAAGWYGKVADRVEEPALRETAFWERAHEIERRGDWQRAREDYARVASLGLARAADAAFRAGLLWYAEGHGDSARAEWRRSGTEGAEFWTAVSWRGAERAGADSALDVLASRPGYTFYRAAARDTLGRRGRPAELAPAAAPDSGDETLALARDLVALGESEDAGALLQRWYAGDPRLPASSRTAPRPPGGLLYASRLAYAAGRPALGIQIARRAIEATPESGGPARWAAVPWAYPPAYDSLVAARAHPGGHSILDRELLLALIWQESKFDPAARSRSGAIGLMQLKPSVANSMARMRREYPPPGERGLMDPATNIRYGTRLLEELEQGFDGHVSLVLAAYNAGPSSAARWRRTEAVGGEALEAELFEYAETQDYVKSILAARQAYRELAPVAGRMPAAPAR